jgi:hypothetical protein
MTHAAPPLNRHAELVSASIEQPRAVARGEKWTLKQVQGDEEGGHEMTKFLLPAALLIYPAWLGAHHSGFGQVSIFAVIFAVVLFFVGPKSHEVQHNPSKPLMFAFALVLAAGLTGVGYGLGYFLFG